MYANGQGVPQDYAEAVKWYRKAADQGDAHAQSNLGACTKKGQGVPQDYAEAVKWYRKAADQGNATAQYNLGGMYDKGKGVPQDYAEAVKWYRLAADQGNADAQFNLGVMYDNGQGVPQDYAEAMKWYRLAADQGNAAAQNNLGVLYKQGQGVPQDYAVAMKWFSLSAAQGFQDAVKARDEIMPLMTPAQIAKVRKPANSAEASAQEAPITDCDKYAASDTDPSAKAPGVPLDKVKPALAIQACKAAVRQFPKSPRLLFQLGRAYRTADNFNSALEYCGKAAEQNYAAAEEKSW